MKCIGVDLVGGYFVFIVNFIIFWFWFFYIVMFVGCIFFIDFGVFISDLVGGYLL